jgi:hypothetical protein
MEQDLGAKEMQQDSHEGQTSMAHVTDSLSMWGLLIPPSLL